METSMPTIASDSFSYSWLSNCNKSPLEGLDHHEPLRKSIYSSYGGTPEQIFNSSIINSHNNSLAECRNFNFDTCITHHSLFVHADELFSDGILRPVFASPSNSIVESCNTTDPTQPNKLGSSSLCSRTDPPKAVEIHHHGLLKRWRKSTQQILVYLLRYANQLCQKVGHSRKSTRVDDIDKADWQVKSLSSSLQASPKTFTSHPIGDWHDHENSIYEAVLHCKRSENDFYSAKGRRILEEGSGQQLEMNGD